MKKNLHLAGTGVYQLRNLVNGKVYVGGAYLSLRVRRNQHFSALRRNIHKNQHLQAAWNFYGESNFIFEVLERCSPEEVEAAEQKWIDSKNAFNRLTGYNKSPHAGSTLGTPNPNKGKPGHRHSPASRLLMRETNKGKANALRGVPKSEEHRRKLSEASKKQWSDEAARRKMSLLKQAQYAARPELRKRLSEANQGKKQSSETTAKRVAKLRGKKRTPEQRARMSAGAIERERRKRRGPNTWDGLSASPKPAQIGGTLTGDAEGNPEGKT